MSVAIPVTVPAELATSFADFKRGKSEHQWMSFRLSGNDMNQLEFADAGAKGETHDAFVERALVGNEPRFCFVNFAYDLEQDGKRCKCVLVLWVPSKSSVRAKMIAAASRSQIKKLLGFGFGIEVQAGDKSDACADAVLQKCQAISR